MIFLTVKCNRMVDFVEEEVTPPRKKKFLFLQEVKPRIAAGGWVLN